MARRPVFFVLLALALVGGAAGASAEDGGPGAIAPGADAISQPCVSIPDSSEFASCFSVTAAIDRAPSVGGTARMGVEVQASAALDAELVIYFPISLEVIDGPGSLQEVRPSPARTGDVAVWVVPLALEGFAPEHLGFTLKAVSDGIAIIEMRLAGENPWDPGDFHVVGFTIGGHGRTASLDVDLSGDAPATVVPAVLVPEPLDRPNEAVPPPAVDPVNDDGTSRSTRAAQSCASGRWSFQAADGTWDPVYNARIEIWDDDTNSGDDRLATGITSSADGSYNLCWTEDEGEGTNQEVYVRVRSFNDIWEVINDDGNYYSTRTTGVVSIAPGSDHDFGHRGTNAQQHRAFSAFDAIDRFWRWGNDPAGSCFDWGESTCRKVVVVWFATSNHGTHFHRVDDSNVAGDQEHQIHLEADIPDTPVIVIHEGGHAAMDDVYNDNRAASDCPADHFAWLESAIRCGWTEGFANWVGISVLDDPFYRWPDGETLPFETPTWGSGEPTTGWGDWEDGAKVEGRVTGAMWDIADTPVAATDYWDRFAEGDTPQWRTFQRWASLGDGNPPRTYAQYWTDRGQDGLNTSDAGARAANYQNTIDIGGEFRDPLPPNGVRLRPSPRNDAHEYSLDPQYGYWSVVAIRPTVDHDLALYDSRNGSGLLSSSTWSGNSFDVIAIDGNHKTDDDFPRVTGSVDGNYDIEWASFNDTIGNGAINLNFVGDIAAVFDSRHNAGERVYYRVVPPSGQTVTIMLFESMVGASGSYVRNRSQAVADAHAFGSGGAEAFSYVASETDWLGFVILHRTGNGSVQVYRDVTGPTVGLTIDAGAAITTDRPVSLAITASDPQTGIRRMRFSTDGTFDFEPWQAPSGSGTVTLPVGDGIKQVWVQAENQAGIRTNTSDTIRLYTGPRCAGNLPTQFDSTEGDDVINGTSARDVIHGRGGDDVINGLSGHDILCGGDGNDVIRGANGNDRMWGDAGADLLIGHRGNDKMYGGGGNDRLQGRLGNDRMDGGLGKDDRCNGSLGPADVAIACERISGVP